MLADCRRSRKREGAGSTGPRRATKIKRDLMCLHSDAVEQSRGQVWSEGGGRGTTAHRRRNGRYLRCLEEEPFLVTAIASRVGTGTQSVEKTTGELFMSL